MRVFPNGNWLTLMLHSLYSTLSVYLGAVLMLTRPNVNISVNAAPIIFFKRNAIF